MKNPHKLICVQALSSLSLWLDIFLVFTVPVYRWQASPSSIAMLAFCLGAPMLFLGPVVGTLIDRQDVRKTLLVGAMLRIASTIGLAFSPNFNVFLGLLVLKSISNLIYFPSITVAVQQLISTDERKSFFSSVSLLDQSSKILAPLLAGLLTVILLPNNIFFLSAASVFFSLPILVSLCAAIQPKLECAPSKVISLYRDILRGFSIFKLLPFQLRVGFLYSLLTSLALGVYDPHLASFLAHEGLPPVVFSMIISATAAGAVGAALLVKFKLKTVDEVVIRTYALIIFSIALLVTATLTRLQIPGRQFLYPVVWFINGFGYELLIISSSIILQQLCPSENIGRVSTSFRSVQILCVIIGPILGTALITAGDRATPLVTAACAAFFTASMSTAVYFLYYRKPVYAP
ncbi:MFS transporter [Pseudomonas sp. JAI120]|uniref:MFS transporter n=1 Tax=Pseudomonas sp. JAI120 TaxID=2723063 RepID=UPI0030D8BDC1